MLIEIPYRTFSNWNVYSSLAGVFSKFCVMKINSKISLLPLLSILSLLFIQSCAMGPDYERPEIDLPEPQADTETIDITQYINPEWWKVFGDPVLDEVVVNTLDYNKDLKQALARVSEAHSLARIAFADLLPTVNAGGGYSKSHPSTKTLSASPEATFSDYNWLGIASYELDIWGKYRRLDEAAWAEYISTENLYDNVRLVLIANAVRAYISLRAFDEKLSIAKRTLKSRTESYRLYKAQYENGYVSELDFKRVAAEMFSVEAQVNDLEDQLARADTALAVITGKTPKQIVEGTQERGKLLDELTIIDAIPENLPSEILAMRPDIASAEQLLISANAQIGVARASFFPSISLTGSFGQESLHLSNLFDGGARVWNWGGTANLPIFQGGRLYGNLKFSEARKEEMLANYELTVQNAFKDALDALSTNRFTRLSLTARQKQTDALRRSLDLANIQRDAGLIGILDVLDVERGLLQAEMDLTNARMSQLFAVVGVCEAFGGGWKLK